MSKPTTREIAVASDALQKVGLFMRTFLQPTPLGYINAHVDLFQLRASLIEEEFLEFLESKNRLDQLDALCDLLYVAAGGFITCGFRMKEFKAFAIAKPFARAVAEARRAFVVQPCESGLRNHVSSLILTTIRSGHAMFPRFKGAFDAVHENNMAKAWTKEELIHKPEGAISIKCSLEIERCYMVMSPMKKVIKPPTFIKVDLQPFL